MPVYTNILLVMEGGQDESQTIRQALSQAREGGGTLTALALCPSLPNRFADFEERAQELMVADARQKIEAAAADLKTSSAAPPIATAVLCDATDSPTVAIIQRVLLVRHDLVVKQASKPTGREGMHALDMQLLRQCPCPVWLSRPIARSRGEIRVAVAIDPTSHGDAAKDLALDLLRAARQLADQCDGVLRIISCWDYAQEEFIRDHPMISVSRSEMDQIITNTEQSHREALDKTIAAAGLTGRIEVIHRRGQPPSAIPAFVDEHGVDILVMGTVARTGIPGWVMGNTAENTLQNLSCSLLAMKPKSFKSPMKV